MAIFVPIYHDLKTPNPFRDPTIPSSSPHIHQDLKSPRIEIPLIPDDHLYLDAMGFGMGCCCLQLTFQTTSLLQARQLYDALVPVAPIMMALSAGTPILKGFLSDWDCRWNVISGSVDDRTESERGKGRGVRQI